MKLADVGERRIIEVLSELLPIDWSSPLPFGDDASAIDLGDGNVVVLKTDMFVRRTDAPKGMRFFDMGWKAVTMNVSDLAAKGARPVGFLFSMGVPRNYDVSDVAKLAKGIGEAAKAYGFKVLGGDTGEACDLIISGMAVGVARKDLLVRRSGAKPGDYLAVTGKFGLTGAGLEVLLRKLKPHSESARRKFLRAVFRPVARLDEGVALSSSKALSSSIDSSDGLAISLHELSRLSGVGFKLHKIPMDRDALAFARHHGLSPEQLALYSGEEYELVVTVRRNMWGAALSSIRRVGGRLIRIGVATRGRRVVYVKDGEEVEIPYRGWEHFR